MRGPRAIIRDGWVALAALVRGELWQVVVDDRELLEIVFAPQETRHIDFKESMAFGGDHRASIVKDILAMASLEYRGYIVIGVAEDPTSSDGLRRDGARPADLQTWTQDAVGAVLAPCADPPVECSVRQVAEPSGSGTGFVVLVVEPSQRGPVICTRNKGDSRTGKTLLLKEGTVYIRSAGSKPESVPVQEHREMRELLDRAIDRGVAGEVEKLRRLGLIAQPPAQPTDAELFDQEAGDL